MSGATSPPPSPAPRQLGRDFSWVSAGYVVRSLAFLALTAVLAAALGPAGYGELSLFLALGATIAFLAASWPFLAVPVLASGGGPIGAVFRPALALAGAGAVLSTAIAVPLAAASIGGDAESLALLIVYGGAALLLQGLYSVLQTEGRMRAIAAAQSADRLAALALVGLIAALASVTVRNAELAIALSAAAVCAGLYAVISRRTPLLRTSVAAEGPGMAGVLRAVGPMAVVTVCSYVVAWIDLLILAAFRPDADVGLYALAYQIFTFVLQVGSLWIVVALPESSRRAAAGEDRVEALLPERRLRAGIGLWAASVALLALAAAVALTLVFGPDFEGSAGPLMVLLASAALIAPYLAAVPVMIALGRTGELALISVAGAALNVTLDLALIPAIGIWGPAVATAAQNVAVTIAVGWVVLGPRRSAALAALAMPAAGGAGLLAADPREPVLIVGATLLAAVAIVSWLRSLRALATGTCASRPM